MSNSVTSSNGANELSDESLRSLYAWIDGLPLSRPKKNISRDFSDGVLFAEVIAYYFPELVELHNYVAASSFKQKCYNLETLNLRVLKKLGFLIPKETMEDIAHCRPGAVEFVLNKLQFNIAKYKQKRQLEQQKKAASESMDSIIDGPIGNSNAIITATASSGGGGGSNNNKQMSSPMKERKSITNLDSDIITEKDKKIKELEEYIEIMKLKVLKLEQLVRLKDSKIEKLMSTKS